MPFITDSFETLSSWLEENNFDYKLGLKIIPQRQKGQICKLNALSTVLNSLSALDERYPKPLPIRKNGGQYAYSIRQRAKEHYGSQVGEVYSATTLKALAEENGYRCSVFTGGFNSYTDIIRQAIDRGEAPIIFYDINDEGDPTELDGNREHAVVVVGYFNHDMEGACFILSQNGGFYWARVNSILLSTIQLSSCRAPETFFKYDQGWVDSYSMYYCQMKFTALPHDKREALALSKEDGGLKNKILIVNAPLFKNKISFWSSQDKKPPEKIRFITLYLFKAKRVCSHNELIALNGFYKNLWDAQSGHGLI